MSYSFEDIQPPPAPPTPLTSQQALYGPTILPHLRILLYSGEQWEDFVQEWAHFCLKKIYTTVQRLSGPGDRGIDVAGFTDQLKLQGVWDNYQCKHYNRPLRPTDAWPELGKVLWYTYKREYSVPRRYFFVAPRGVGTTLAGHLGNAARLKEGLIENWDKLVRQKITDKQEITLEGDFLNYVRAFDFSIFDAKTSLQLIEDHRACPYHVARFGGGLPSRPAIEPPPAEILPVESRYVSQLLMAYADHKRAAVPNAQALRKWPPLNTHFGRQREAFYHAESLRVFARDKVPPGTFESLQEEVFSGVIDVHDADYPDGYRRVCRVTQAARELQLTSNVLVSCAKPMDRDGICHQLANEDRLQWTSKSQERPEGR